jgi:cell division protein FtsW
MGAARKKRPIEYSILYTATLCLLAAGAVMVYSASSAESLLQGSGDPAFYLKRYVAFAILGLAVLHLASRHGLRVIKALTPLLLVASFVLTIAVMLPGVGVTVNGATRWLGAGPVQFQPSELLKVSLVLYAAQMLAARPRSTRTIGGLIKPLLLVVAAACALLLKQPDMGTAMVICFAIGTLLVAAGTPMRHLATIAGTLAVLALLVALLEPYRRERLTSFLDPFSDAGDTGFQAVQALTAIGSGGFFGVGLGESVQKVFYLPEAHTDMMLAVIGEELGLVGVTAVIAAYGVFTYAGLNIAMRCKDPFGKRLAAGLTVVVAGQAAINIAAVMGVAPLTGIPLPFLSYGGSSLVVLLAGVGILLNIAHRGSRAAVAVPDRSRGNGRSRAARTGSRGRAQTTRRARDVRRVAGSRRSASGS